MSRYGLILCLFVLGLFTLDRLLLWLESRRWIYYRRSKGAGTGALTGGLHELHAALDPGARVVQEVQREEQTEEDEQGEPPTPNSLPNSV
ncbi:MAG: hypothetical protein IT349_08850 [Candidatus Eisenbacteria bacterium]|nr:hypothetical protein [Candidatus Eisenbacteria bacterium]MCC7142194.1 hypothetical protein [Candidatus Eisenbacteria bacterium]